MAILFRNDEFEFSDWRLRSKVPLPKRHQRYGLSAFIADHVLHTVGGTNEAGGFVSDMLRFDLNEVTVFFSTFSAEPSVAARILARDRVERHAWH